MREIIIFMLLVNIMITCSRDTSYSCQVPLHIRILLLVQALNTDVQLIEFVIVTLIKRVGYVLVRI